MQRTAPRMFRLRSTLLGVLIAAAMTTPADAHSFALTDVVVLLKSNGTYMVDLQIDVDAIALGVSPTTPSEELARTLEQMAPQDLENARQHARDTPQRRVTLRFDDQKCEAPACLPRISFPALTRRSSSQAAGTSADNNNAVNAGLRDSDAEAADEPTFFGITARLEGVVPPGSKTFSFSASRAFQQVRLTIFEQSTQRTTLSMLSPGSRSDAYLLNRSDLANTDRSWVSIAGLYLRLGFEHIIPKGLDHILFVLGLFLLSTEWRSLLWQISAFTIAHSVTLALSIQGYVTIPGSIVEPLIAASIAYVAVENLLTSELKPWRPVIVFFFGLLHGMGFASVLAALGIPSQGFVTALAAFNVGVELGQIAVVAIAFLIVGRFRNRPWYRLAVVVPLSTLIALVGLYWCIERTLLA